MNKTLDINFSTENHSKYICYLIALYFLLLYLLKIYNFTNGEKKK